MAHRLLSRTDHRPWALPEAPWALRMDWADLLFAHWRVAPRDLAPLIPPGLALDTFDGSAWVGVVPFRMEETRPRGVPALPGLSAFPELNVRTYVTVDDRPGVYFLSLDASLRLAVWGARRMFALPYFNARMRCETGEDGRVGYASERTHRGAREARFRGRYGPDGAPFLAEPGTLEHFLTERYALYTAGRADLAARTRSVRLAEGSKVRLARGDIHHAPWLLQPAWAELDECTVAAAAGITLPDEPPHLLFVRRIETLAWLPTAVADDS